MPLRRQPGTHPHTHAVPRLQSEDGFILLWVIFLALLLLIALAVAAPRIAISIQRDKELELVHRGEQYRRAIQLYYRKFGTYPTSIDQLLNTDNIRFLRKRYADPITGKDDWRIIHLGEAKVPPMGFFGQPLTGLNGPTSIGTPIAGTAGTPASGASSFGSSFSSSSVGSTGAGSAGFNSPGSTTSSGDSADSAASTPDAAGFSSNTGKDAAGFATDKGNSNPMGGGPIVGVGVPVPKASLIAYKKQTHYNQWEFVYFPIEDQMGAALQGVSTQSGASSSNDDGFGNLMGNGSGTNSPGSGSGAFGSGNFGSGASGPSGTGNPSSSPNESQDQQQ